MHGFVWHNGQVVGGDADAIISLNGNINNNATVNKMPPVLFERQVVHDQINENQINLNTSPAMMR